MKSLSSPSSSSLPRSGITEQIGPTARQADSQERNQDKDLGV